MYQSLTRDPNETCAGHWYRSYPTIENTTKGEYFTFELLPDGIRESAHLVDNLKATDERIIVRTSFRYDFSADSYVAAFGNLYKIDRINVERKIQRGVAVPRVKYALHLIQCANPLSL